MARAKKQTDAPVTNEPSTMASETPAAPVQPRPLPPPRRKRRGLLFWLLFLALVAVSYWAFTLYRENQDLKDPEAQARRIVAQMGKHILLPDDEVPGVFPIDRAQATEPFFKNAQDGDLLVVYRSTQQAFIWSPSRNILVNAGVLVVEPGQDKVPSGPSAAKPAVSEEAAEEPAPAADETAQ